MVETLSQSSPSAAVDRQGNTPASDPVTLGGKTRATMTRLGNNIDLINLYARQKDWYKIFEVVGAVVAYGFQRIGSSLTGGVAKIEKDIAEVGAKIDALSTGEALANAQNEMAHLKEQMALFSQKARLEREQSTLKSVGRIKGQMVADTLNTGLQIGISEFSRWWEKNQLLRVYGESLKQEFGTQKATYDDLKRSQNPIIRNATDYYERKALWRSVPDYLGLVKVVPYLAEKIAPNSKFGGAMRAAQKLDFSGIDLSLGAKTLFFLWYFIERQTGGHYELMKIWNKTEGVKNQSNLSVNQNVHPGEMVTQEEITGLYREVARERKLRDFSPYDPLTGRIFEQIARYTNHHYMPDLYEVKRPTLKHEELEGTHFTHADLVALFGTEGININDAYATSLRLEVLARKGMDDYRLVNQKIGQLHRPTPEEYPNKSSFGKALDGYLHALDTIAEDTLGAAWPAPYINERIRPGIHKAYGLTEDSRRLSQIIADDGPTKSAATSLPNADERRVAPTMALGNADAGHAAADERRMAPTMALGQSRVESSRSDGGFAARVGEPAENHAERAERSKEQAEGQGASL